MKCKCCFAQVGEDNAFCTVCGFSLFSIVDESGKAEFEQKVISFRKEKLKDITISVSTFAYTYENGALSAPEVIRVKLAEAAELEYGKLLWSEQEFAPVPSNRSFPLEIIISDGSEERSVTLTLTPEKPVSHTLIGAELCEGFSVKLAVGTKDNFVYSEPVSLNE